MAENVTQAGWSKDVAAARAARDAGRYAALMAARPRPTSAEDVARIEGLVDRLAVWLSNLAARWEDERGHEPWSGYEGAMRGSVEGAGFGFLGTTRRPFGFLFSVPGMAATYRMTSTPTGRAAWKRL